MAQAEPNTVEKTSGQIIWKGKPTVLSFYDGLIGGVLLVVVSTVVFSVFPSLGPLAMLGVLCGLLLVLFAFTRAWANTYLITDRAVRREYRLVVVRVEEAAFKNITNAVLEQDIIGRIFGFGDVRFDTAGSPFQGVLFKGIKNPAEVKRIVDDRLRSL
ncbi:MAG: PH domain-containing protein [Nitrososphaerota archaeon]